MQPNESLVLAELLNIQRTLGVLEERTEPLPGLCKTVAELKQELHDHMEEAPGRKPRSRRAQGGIFGLALAAIAGVSIAATEVMEFLGR